MASSEVAISNMALDLLGAARITSLADDSRNARACNACYAQIRDQELRAHVWNFSKKRATLAASAVTPDFDFDYAFPLPTGCLRVLPPKRTGLDWTIENHDGRSAILTNDGDTLEVVYIAQITDPTVFDALFDDALAAKMALHMCEAITQSNAKKADAKDEYVAAIRRAKRVNAIEQVPQDAAEDTWLAARR